MRETVVKALNTYWRTGLLAVVVCVAISCIQWLPLLELAAQSHRQQGVGIAINGTPEFLIRGLLYSIDNFTRTDIPNKAYFPNTGSPRASCGNVGRSCTGRTPSRISLTSPGAAGVSVG